MRLPASVSSFPLTAPKLAANSSVALAFAVGRDYEATDAAKRLKFGASPTDGVAETEPPNLQKEIVCLPVRTDLIGMATPTMPTIRMWN